MSLVKVTDANTGKLKRYEDENGQVLAKVSDGRLKITPEGQIQGYVTRGNKIVAYNSGVQAY